MTRALTPLALLHLVLLAVLAWIIGGPGGWAYIGAYVLVCAAGLPLGFALFGRRHAAGWIAGGVLGYGLVAFAWGLAVQAGVPRIPVFVLTWIALPFVLWAALRRTGPLVRLPSWTRRDTAALLLALLIVPAIAGVPFSRIGERGDDGLRRYRAYFTADYLWHVALTAELARFDSPPRNPYLVSEPLHYYWTYFNVPAVLSAMRGGTGIDRHVLLNALSAGLLFIAAILIAAWCAIPRAGPVAVAVLLTVAAASAEGLYAMWDIASRGAPMAELRELNIDAITSWFLQSLTIDSLPRSLWYTPQHAFACACGLVALMLAPAAAQAGPVAQAGPGAQAGPVAQAFRPAFPLAIWAGIALGLSLVSSPFLGGSFALLYGLTAAWAAIARRRLAGVFVAAIAAVPVGAALAWCVWSGTFEGAGGSVAIGLSRRAARAPWRTLALALGPILLLASIGLGAALKRRLPVYAAVASLAFGLFLLYFVTLTKEEIWVGWRAGQVILVTIPALAAAALAWLWDARRRLAAALAVIVAALGLPTTLIDAYNASDTSNFLVGPGEFKWTVALPRDSESAVNWIRTRTPRNAVVQMSIGPRGRETWTLIPTFAERRMAAGQPISLLRAEPYDRASRDADAMFATTDAAEAWRLARALGVHYVYVDEVERRAFGPAAIDKFKDPRYFSPVYWKADAEVIQVK